MASADTGASWVRDRTKNTAKLQPGIWVCVCVHARSLIQNMLFLCPALPFGWPEAPLTHLDLSSNFSATSHPLLTAEASLKLKQIPQHWMEKRNRDRCNLLTGATESETPGNLSKWLYVCVKYCMGEGLWQSLWQGL